MEVLTADLTLQLQHLFLCLANGFEEIDHASGENLVYLQNKECLSEMEPAILAAQETVWRLDRSEKVCLVFSFKFVW